MNRPDTRSGCATAQESPIGPPQYIQAGLFEAFAIRDGRLTTGQQQYSRRKVALAALGL